MISRDGSRISLWQDNVNSYTATNTKKGEAIYDVAIVGGGITGVTLGLQLQKAGKNCIILEANNLGFGTTGGTTAHLNTLMDTPYSTIIKNFNKDDATLVAQAARQAIELIKRNIQTYNIDCGFEEVPAYLFSQSKEQADELRDIFDSCNEVGVEVNFDSELPIPRLFDKVMRVERQAKFNPLQYVRGLAQAFEAAGGTIVQQCRVTGTHNEESITLETEQGNVVANKVVYATHIPPGINLIHLRCSPYRSYAMAVKLKGEDYPAGLVYDMYDPYHYYRTQEVNGQNYLIVGGEDHKTGEIENTLQCFLKLENHVRKHFDVEEVNYQWSSQYYEPTDGLPYIGHLPGGSENEYVASGYGGNGMTYSQVAAMVLSDLIMGVETPYKKLFNPLRIKPVAGFTEFVKHNVDVVKQFITKRFEKDEIEEVAAIAPEEGKIVKYENQTLALYKDEAGGLHCVNPTCTHMKCSVGFNTAEKSWDCPCHGARYSVDGKVLNGPADKDLEQVSLSSLIEPENSIV